MKNRIAANYGLECSSSLYSQAVFMPQAIGALLIPLLASAGGVTLLGEGGLVAFATGLGYAAVAAAALGLQLALRQKPATPSPSDVQSNIRQEISARRRVHSRYLMGSVIVFGFRRGDKSYLLHYICEGPIKGYVSFRLDKKPVTLDEDGFVTTDQYVVDGRSRVQLLTTLGTMSDEPFPELLAAFPELDTPATPFRHRGCAMVLQIVEQVPAEDLQDTYPNNMPSLQVVIDGLDDTLDPRTMTTGMTGNASCCLLSETMSVYGLTADDDDEINFASFAAFADRSDEDVALKAGGTEKRWQCAGPISMDGENEDRIKSIAAICNAEVYIDPQGRIAVREKMTTTPGIALRARNGDHLDIQMEGGRPLQKRFNTTLVSYVDPNLNWKANQVRWRHQGLYDDDGEELTSDAIGATLCPSGTQAQRIAKLAVYEANPDFVGQVTSGPQALDLMENYAFTLDLSPEEEFERTACATGVIEYNGDQMTVQTGFAVFMEGATDWNPAVDEQDQVVIPPVLPSNVDDVELDVTAAAGLLENSAPVLNFSWLASGAATLPDSYSQQVQVSAADADDWHDATVNQKAHTAQYGPVADGGAYDWRIRNIASGKTFDWQNSTAPVSVIADSTPPADLKTVTATGSASLITIGFGTATDAHLRSVAVYRVPAGGTLDRTAHLATKVAVAPGVTYSIPVTAPVGKWDVYVEPLNGSNVNGTTVSFVGTIVSFADSFTRADGNLDGTDWTRSGGSAGTFTIASNQVAQPSAVNDVVYFSPDGGQGNQYVQAKVVAGLTAVGGTGPFVALRLQDANNFIGFRVIDNYVALYKRVGGTFTQLGSNVTRAVGDVFKLTASGTTLNLYKNGSLALGPITEASLSTVTKAGLVSRGAANPFIDDYQNAPL